MEIKGTEIKSILGTNLEIPENQRKYDWSSVHADDLWNDLLEYTDQEKDTLLRTPGYPIGRSFQYILGLKQLY